MDEHTANHSNQNLQYSFHFDIISDVLWISHIYTYICVNICVYMYVYAHVCVPKHTFIRNFLWKNTEQTIHIRIHSIQFFLILAVIFWGGDNTTNIYTNAQLHTDGGEGGGEDGNTKSPDARQGLAGRDALKSMGVL